MAFYYDLKYFEILKDVLWYKFIKFYDELWCIIFDNNYGTIRYDLNMIIFIPCRIIIKDEFK